MTFEVTALVVVGEAEERGGQAGEVYCRGSEPFPSPPSGPSPAKGPSAMQPRVRQHRGRERDRVGGEQPQRRAQSEEQHEIGDGRREADALDTGRSNIHAESPGSEDQHNS